MPQQYKVTICRRQQFYNSLYLGPPLRPFMVLFGRRPPAFDLELVRAIRVLGLETLGVDRVSPHVVYRSVVGDAIKPGRELIFGTVFLERIVDLDENFLGDVERVDAVLCVTGMRQRPRRVSVGSGELTVCSARHLARVVRRLPPRLDAGQSARAIGRLGGV